MLRYVLLIGLLCRFVDISTAYSEEAATGSISGKILAKNGALLSEGKVMFFRADAGPPPSQNKYWRIPDEIVDIQADSSFTAVLPEGKYFLSALKKKVTDSIGPPKEGDLIYPESRRDLKNEQESYFVAKGKNIDIGVIAGAVSFKRPSGKADSGITAIQGKVVDEKGTPVSDAIVFAYLIPKFTGKPVFSSERTDKRGRFLLRVSDGGLYYVKARTTHKAGHPIEGEMIGVYGNQNPLPVRVKSGEIKTGIDVVGSPFAKQKAGDSSTNKRGSR